MLKNIEEKYQIKYSNKKLSISDIAGNYKIDLKKRLLDFAINTLRFLMTLPYKKEFDVLRYQLSRSATSIGANYREAQTSTINEFLQKIRIALREANESTYWFEIIQGLKIGEEKVVKSLHKESMEIALILGSIAAKLDRKRKQENIK
jgi:four helix bundle protein